MKFDELKVGSRVKCPMEEHGVHTVIALPRETGYGVRVEALRHGTEPTHYAQFDDGSMISGTNGAIADFTLVDETPC